MNSLRLTQLSGMQCDALCAPGGGPGQRSALLLCSRSCILSSGSSYWSHVHVQLEDGRRDAQEGPFPTLPGHSLEVIVIHCCSHPSSLTLITSVHH